MLIMLHGFKYVTQLCVPLHWTVSRHQSYNNSFSSIHLLPFWNWSRHDIEGFTVEERYNEIELKVLCSYENRLQIFSNYSRQEQEEIACNEMTNTEDMYMRWGNSSCGFNNFDWMPDLWGDHGNLIKKTCTIESTRDVHKHASYTECCMHMR